jgi:hypothetical protein
MKTSLRKKVVHEKPVIGLVPEELQNLSEIRRAAEGLKALQREITATTKRKQDVTWAQFKSFVEKGHR